MKKKILFCASASSHINNFHQEYFPYLKDKNFIIHTVSDNFIQNENTEKSFALKFEKSKSLYKNVKTLFALIKIIRHEKYNIISTHSMLAGFLGRLAMVLSPKKNIKVIHTCHGYLFEDKGFRSKLIIFAEKVLSLRTNILFVMNGNDYTIAKKYKLCPKIKYINGMGLMRQKLKIHTDEEIAAFREKNSISDDKLYFLCVGEFSKRKSQITIIQAFSLFLKNLYYSKEKYRLVFLGDGNQLNYCMKTCQVLNIDNYVIFNGYTEDTSLFYQTAYCLITASKYEGLPFNVMEALHYNLPIIASDAKGNKDLIKDNFNGFLFEYGNYSELSDSMEKVTDSYIYGNLKSNSRLDEKYYFENIYEDIIDCYTSL